MSTKTFRQYTAQLFTPDPYRLTYQPKQLSHPHPPWTHRDLHSRQSRPSFSYRPSRCDRVLVEQSFL